MPTDEYLQMLSIEERNAELAEIAEILRDMQDRTEARIAAVEFAVYDDSDFGLAV